MVIDESWIHFSVFLLYNLGHNRLMKSYSKYLSGKIQCTIAHTISINHKSLKIAGLLPVLLINIDIHP